MAILKDLIVHGSSRFLNKIYASEIQTPLIEAEAGIFKKLKADDVTIVGLLDVQGQMHTNSWTNSNIATIDGSFYITPTLSSSSGTVSFSSATAATFTGTYSAVSSLYIGNDTASTVQWTSGSKILITGEVQVDEEWIPLGTLLGTLNSTNPTTSMPIVNITDNRNNTSNILTNIYSLKSNDSLSYRNLKISLYQRADNSEYYPLGIFMTALGQNGKTFLDIYGGVNALTTSYGGYANPNVRIGNLSGLPAITTSAGNFSPVGWGIYTTNGYFSGTIVSNTGVIGGWKLGANSLYNETSGLNDNTVGIYLGTDGIRNYLTSTQYVNITGGKIIAQGVDLTGEITASSGSIGGWNIGTDTNKSLYYGNQTPGATTTNLILSPTSATNSNAIGGSSTGLTWFISAGKVFGVTTAGALYCNDAHISGEITTTSGTIGGFQIDSSSIHTKNVAITSNADNSIALSSVDFTRTINSISRTGLRFAIGDKFGVTGDGTVYASDVDLTGKITATQGEIGGINIIDGDLDVSSINIGDLNGASNYALKTEVTDAEKVATSYITYIDSTEGIKIHNISDQDNYLKLNSSAISMYRNNIETLNISNNEIRIGKFSDNNVYIDSDSVDIRNGQNTLASFTGNNTKFYDIEQNREVASFGANGVRVGNKDEQHFIVDSESIQAINENGSSIFSVQSTGGTITTEIVVAKGGNSQPHTDWEVYLNGGSSVPQNTFYAKEYSLLIDIDNSINTFNSMTVSVNDGNFQNVPVVRTQYQNSTGMTVYSRHLVTLPPFSFQYGTETVYKYHVEGVYVSDKGNTYRYSSTIHIPYDGQRTITMDAVGGTLTQTSGSVSGDNTSVPYGGNSTIWGDIYSSLGYAKAPAMTFGTRGKAGIVAPLSVTIGEELYANNDNQLSIGRYNLDNDENFPLAFAIGNGTSDNNRSNAFNVDWDGNVKNMGDLEVGESLIVDGSADNIPNITINKESTNATDYIKCQDANLDAKFRVLNDGGVIVGHDLLVKNSQTINKNLTVTGIASIVGNIRLNGRLLDASSANNPLFKIVTTTVDNLTISYNNGVSSSVVVSASGYTPIAIGSYQISNASNYTSSYAAWTWSIMNYHLLSGGRIYYYIGNWHSSSALRVKLTFTVLCIKSTAL